MEDDLGFGVDLASVTLSIEWVTALREGRIEDVWRSTDYDYRMALTQWWMAANPGVQDHPSAGPGDRSEIATRIAKGDNPLSPHLFRVLNRDLGASLVHLDGLELVAGTAARPLSLDLEAVALFVADDVPEGVFAPGAQARVVTVAVRLRKDVRYVAGLNCVALPGWPPVFDAVDPTLS